jgi:tRNA(fMet)-specific endonuclease VapC
MKYLLDTNACISHLRFSPRSPISRKLADIAPQSVALCSVVKAELFFGVLRSREVEKNRRQLERFLAAFPSIPFDDRAAEAYGQIRSHLAARGTPIGPNDLMIASIALANALVLVSHNAAQFRRVPNLTVEDWEAPAMSE